MGRGIDNSIDFFSGVPDSLLKEFCFCIDDRAAKQKHIIAANEGNAIALAAGYHLATDKIPLVYMQNAGFGNAINPLLSLCDRNVYSIPMLIVIGWRGEPEVGDEPQHVKQGKVTLKLFDLLDIPYRIMPDTNSEVKDCLDHLIKIASEKKTPVALVVKKNTFKEYKVGQKKDTLFELTREESIKLIVGKLNPVDIVVSTTGKTSRELYEYREQLQQGHNKDFLVIGSMGHSSQIALAIALEKPLRQVFCLDGDGSVIMHMGSLAIIGSQKVSNFKHIIINNGSHDSVGGQPTVGFSISFVNIDACVKSSHRQRSAISCCIFWS
jgi:phosphonopyruvate decarboxylase